MKRSSLASIVAAAMALTIGAVPAVAQAPEAVASVRKESAQTMHANGTFEVKLAPQGAGDSADGTSLGRLTLDKQFQGDLQGSGKGEMLTAMTAVKESAGYVAIERVTGTLNGRSGGFILQHNGTMTRGQQQLIISVVPDSGTGQLAGIAGTMTIKIEGGKHFYALDYTLPAER